MSDRTPPAVGGFRGTVRGGETTNAYGGLTLVVLALLALGISFYHPGPAGFFGPVIWPRAFSLLILLAGLGMASGQLPIRNKQDFYGGLALIGLAIVAQLASIDLPGMRGFAFGPGTAPRLFANLLAVLGFVVTMTGLTFDGPEGQRYTVMGIVVVAGSAAIWGLFQWALSYATPYYAQPIATAALIVVAVAGMDILDRVGVRGPYLITLSIFAFAVFIRPLGLVLASFLSIMVCAGAASEIQGYRLRGPIMIMLPVLTFAIFVWIWPFTSVGYREFTAAFLSVIICAAVAPDLRWRETVIVAGALTAFCAFLFPYGLNLPFQLWPRF